MRTTDSWSGLRSKINRTAYEGIENSPPIALLQSSSVSFQNTLPLQSINLVDLKHRSRRSNIIGYGINEYSGKNKASLKKSVVEGVFDWKLGVKCKSIACIYCLGRQEGRCPVIAYFEDYTEKQAISQSASQHNGTNIFIQNDYSQKILCSHKLLWDSTKTDRENARISFAW